MENTIITRYDAAAVEKLYYFTGKPCINGHIAVRYVSTGACKECIKDHNKMTRQTLQNMGVARSRGLIPVVFLVPRADVDAVKTVGQAMGYEVRTGLKSRQAPNPDGDFPMSEDLKASQAEYARVMEEHRRNPPKPPPRVENNQFFSDDPRQRYGDDRDNETFEMPTMIPIKGTP
jgi:hypothetical protein